MGPKGNNKDVISRTYKQKSNTHGIGLKDQIHESFHRRSKLNVWKIYSIIQ